MNKIFPLLVSFFIIAALVYFSGPEQLYSTIAKADKKIIALGIGVWFVSSILRTARWQNLLNEVGIKTTFPVAYRVFNAGLFISIITPGKVGDPARSVLLKKATGESFSKSLPTIVIERMCDITIMMALGIFGFLYAPVESIRFYFMVASAVYIMAIVGLIFTFISRDRLLSVTSFFVDSLSFFPQVRALKPEVGKFADGFHESFTKFSRKRTLSVTALMTLLIWLLEGVILALGFYSIGLTVNYPVLLTALMISTLVSVLTFLPGGLGSSEVVLVVFFTSVLSLPLASITSAALLSRLMGFWITVAIGSYFLAGINKVE